VRCGRADPISKDGSLLGVEEQRVNVVLDFVDSSAAARPSL